MKNTYKQAFNKRKSQKDTIRGEGKLIGLGGIDLKDYVRIVKRGGFKDIIIYENNRQVFMNQLSNLPKGINLIYADIRDNLENDAFYDLDFCKSIINIRGDLLQRIVKLKRFALTLSIRPLGIAKTIKEMKKYANLPYIIYRDTSPMITFYKH